MSQARAIWETLQHKQTTFLSIKLKREGVPIFLDTIASPEDKLYQLL